MKGWWKLGVLALAVGLALLLAAEGLLASEGQGSVTATVKVNPLVVSLTAPSEASVGEEFTVQATVGNLGSSRIRRVTATIHLPPTDLLEVRGPDTHRLRPLGPFGSRSTEWQLTALQSGGFVLMVTASGVDASDRTLLTTESDAPLTTESEASLITVE